MTVTQSAVMNWTVSAQVSGVVTYRLKIEPLDQAVIQRYVDSQRGERDDKSSLYRLYGTQRGQKRTGDGKQNVGKTDNGQVFAPPAHANAS